MVNKHCDCPCHRNKDKCPQGGFCCPGYIPADVPNNRFGSPNVCPDTIPTPRYNSPNSSLPIQELNRLQVCIEEINDTLRTIGNPRDPENPEEPQRQRQLQQHFRALRGSLVRVVVTCHDEKVSLLGILEDAGANFILLNTLGEKKLLLFERICLLKHENNDAETFDHQQELLYIDKCLRREITFHFGDIVGRSPELINIFFGIPLHLYMLPFIGCKIAVKTDEEELISGILCEIDENQFRLEVKEEAGEDEVEENEVDPCVEEDGIRTINFAVVCFISINS